MKLKTIKIKNYRCYRDEFVVNFDDLTALIAKNDIGKSTILDAINVFFNLEKLEAGDRSVGLSNSVNIEITCIFDHLPTELIIDTDNLISPVNEYLLNSFGDLEVCKVFKGASPKCEEIYLNTRHPTLENFDDLFDLTIAQLKTRARNLDVDLTDVNQSVRSAIRHAIWASVDEAELALEMVSLEIKKSIWKPVQNSLPLFQLFKSDRPSSDQDAEAQDPIKFAIKEALSRKSEELSAIGDFVKEQVEEVANTTIEKLREMDPELASQLNPKFSSFNWSKVFSVSLTDDEQIPLNKRGSGVRRLFLINFFRAKVEQLASEREVQDVIFAIEEPETSQHPNNQILLLDALVELSQESSNQVVFTTHNPILAGRVDKDSIRFICKADDGTRSIANNDEETIGAVRDSLGMFANHNIKVFVGVEGPNDIEYVKRISAILSPVEEDIAHLEQAETDGHLVYIPMGGSTLELWTNRLEGLNVPEVHILDRDNPLNQTPKYQAAADRVNDRGDDCIAFITGRREMENYIHHDAINEECDITIQEPGSFDDVPVVVARAVHEESDSPVLWDDLDEEKKSKKVSRAKKRLNRGAIDRMTPERLNAMDEDDDVRSWLRKISSYLT